MSQFYDILYYIYDTCCPIRIKTLSSKDIQKPWITRDMLNSIKRRNNLFLLHSNCKVSREAYNRYRNYVTGRIRGARLSYYATKFETYKTDVKETWKLLNSIIKLKKSSVKINKLIIDDNIITDHQEVCNSFNEYFASVGSGRADSLPACNDHDHVAYLPLDVPNSFFLAPVTSLDVSSILCSMKNKSNGIDVVLVKIFKHLRDLISPILPVLINMSLQVGIFPDLLKVAKVIPLHKAAELFLLANYRPIYLCCRSVANFLKKLCINNYITTCLGIISYLAISLVSDLEEALQTLYWIS